VFKRYFTGDQLAEELGGADVLFEGHWFVIVEAKASPRSPSPARASPRRRSRRTSAPGRPR
jgi:hypothetical protein